MNSPILSASNYTKTVYFNIKRNASSAVDFMFISVRVGDKAVQVKK